MEAATITNHQMSLVRLASVKQQSWPDTDRVKEIAESSEGGFDPDEVLARN